MARNESWSSVMASGYIAPYDTGEKEILAVDRLKDELEVFGN